MSWFSHVASFFRREKAGQSGETPSPSAPSPRYGDLFPALCGTGTALTVGAVYRCVKFLSESVAALPVRCMKRRGSIFADDDFNGLSYLLNVQPDKAYSAFDFWSRAIAEVLLSGNAYIVPVYDPVTMNVWRLVLCRRGTVAHNKLTDRYRVADIENGVSGDYDESEIIHLKGMTLDDPKEGVSVLTCARQTLRIATTGDRETLNRFANGGNVRGIVSNDRSVRGFGEYQDKQLAETAVDIDTRFQGGERIVSLPGQVDFRQISLSSTDMQFLESRKFTVLDICRFFGVHPSFVFEDTSNNYKSAEQANVAFLSHTLNPLLRSIECELQRKLVPQSRARKYKFQFDRRALHACDLDSKVKYQTATIAAGLYSPNDWRLAEDMEPVAGGDTVFVSANLKPITEASAVQNSDNQNTDNDETE